MQIKDVENLAELAKLDLNQEEKEQILKDMGGILEYVKTIEGVDLKGSVFSRVLGVGPDQLEKTEPFKFVNYNVWREDILESREFSKESIIKQFPDSQDNFLKVKKIL